MKKPQKILLPVDFSPVAENAVQYTKSILENQLAEVVLIYVNTHENPRTEQEIKRAFKAFEKESLRGVNFYYEFEILKGNLLVELINASREEDADLIIIGTKANRPSDISLASALIRSVYCPVIVVPENFKKQKIRKIAYANDFRPIQESLSIKPLWEFALEFGAKVYLLHINHNRKGVLVPVADHSESTLEYYLESLDHEYVYLSNENIELAINQYLKEKSIDLLVILSRDHGCNQLESEGRLVAQLTAHAEVPILALC